MPTSTLITKILLPQRREDILTRQRLLNRFYDMIDYKAILLSAPAGYGKTTLLVDFAHDLAQPICWYTLDASDQDPRVFLERLILSIQRRFPNFGEQSMQALHASSTYAQGAPGVIKVIINEIVEKIPQWFVLMLDDYHQLSDAADINMLVANFLSYQTGQCLVIIASRMMPDLPSIIGLVARGGIGGVGAKDMYFQPEEIKDLFVQNYGAHLTLDKAAELATQSEGWITGLLLTAQTMWQGVLNNLVQARNSDQPLYAYLAQEVFEQLSPEIQIFLMLSSTLKEMTADLCEKILALDDAATLLATLEEHNLFVVRLEEGWYRYHHLFREYLQTRLRKSDKAQWRTLHCQAAMWFRDHESPEQAVTHYLAVEAFEEAAAIMQTLARSLFINGRLKTLTRWYTALPAQQLKGAPRLTLFQSRAADMAGEWQKALDLTELAEQGYRAQQDHLGLAYTFLQRCQIWQKQGKFREALALGEKSLALIERENVPAIYEAYRVIGRIHLAQGNIERSVSCLQKAFDLCHEQGSDYACASIQSSLADGLWKLGLWEEAIRSKEYVVDTWRRLNNKSVLAGELNDLGFQYYATGKYKQALDLFREALELAHRAGQQRSEAFALVSLGELARDLGTSETAKTYCEEGLSIAAKLGDTFLTAYAQESLGLVYRRQGNTAAAQTAIEQAINIVKDMGSVYQLSRYETSLGVIKAESGEPQSGLIYLQRAQQQFSKIGATNELERTQLLTAWAYYLAGEKERACSGLKDLLENTLPIRRENLLVLEGQYTRPMLEQAQQQDIGKEILTPVLTKIDQLSQTAKKLFYQPLSRKVEKRVALRIFGFGLGRVEREESIIPASEWGSVTARQLLFYLLIHSQRTREQIFVAFWPDLSSQKAKAAFHTTKFRLSRALGTDAIYFDGRSYSIHPDLNYWFDVAEFKQKLKTNVTQSKIDHLQKACALYRADFLEGCYFDWCILQRNSLKEQCLDALYELSDKLISRRQYRQAIKVLRQALKTDSAQEHFHYQLMRVYALYGRRSQALKQYQQCCSILQQELDTSPSQQTTALYQRILDESPLN